jgi:hypothetical protein
MSELNPALPSKSLGAASLSLNTQVIKTGEMTCLSNSQYANHQSFLKVSNRFSYKNLRTYGLSFKAKVKVLVRNGMAES